MAQRTKYCYNNIIIINNTNAVGVDSVAQSTDTIRDRVVSGFAYFTGKNRPLKLFSIYRISHQSERADDGLLMDYFLMVAEPAYRRKIRTDPCDQISSDDESWRN